MPDTQAETLPEFFLVALPGLEDLAAAEFKAWYPAFEFKLEHGGVTVFAPMETGLSMNLVLKIPTRILLRVARFRCRDFPKLFNKVTSLNWHQWIDTRAGIAVEVSTRASRLKIKKRIEETCLDAWKKYQQKHTGKEKRDGLRVTLFVRILKDECMLSLDTSGERLHKRGIRRHVGDAPLRETIAAALIQMVMGTYETPENLEIDVVDPMMGSGTFLLEAIGRELVVESRDFPFPVFRAKEIQAPSSAPPGPSVQELVGLEQDPKTVSAALANLKELDAKRKPRVHTADVFTAESLPPTTHERWVFVNPPYGERLAVGEPLGDYYARLFAATERIAKPDRACFVLPAKAVKGKFALPMGWRVVAKRPFLNGGIPVVAFVFGRAGRN